MDKILVIIPLNDYNDQIKSYLEDAIKSVPDEVDIVLSVKHGLKPTPDVKHAFTIREEQSDASDFPTLVNNAVDDNYKWFSILEFDDEYAPTWFKNVNTYINFKPDVSVFLPLCDLVDFNKKEFVSYGNEAVWASSFSTELGYIDLDSLQNFFEYYLTGSIFNTADWKEIGGLKTNIPVYFWYEFLLRATNKGEKVFVIPKIGYVHYLGRSGSLLEQYKNTVNADEANYWMSVAKKEYFFVHQRDVKPYVKNSESTQED